MQRSGCPPLTAQANGDRWVQLRDRDMRWLASQTTGKPLLHEKDRQAGDGNRAALRTPQSLKIRARKTEAGAQSAVDFVYRIFARQTSFLIDGGSICIMSLVEGLVCPVSSEHVRQMDWTFSTPDSSLHNTAYEVMKHAKKSDKYINERKEMGKRGVEGCQTSSQT